MGRSSSHAVKIGDGRRTSKQKRASGRERKSEWLARQKRRSSVTDPQSWWLCEDRLCPWHGAGSTYLLP
jgi:hypothetical protein